MSERSNEFKGGSNNPCRVWLEWKSDVGCFEYYNAETKQKVAVPLPVKFLVLKEMHTVKGYNEANNCGIYANEVRAINTEPLTVKTFKGGISIVGLYKEIKDKIEAIGGSYHKSVYAMGEKGHLMNFAFKGSVTAAWGEFTSKSRARLTDEWIEVATKEDLKKGKVSYTVPVFQFNRSLSKEEGVLADAAYDIIDDYLKGVKPSPRELDAAAEVDEVKLVPALDKDTLPF